MPKKPTQPFGHISFSKEGKVTKRTTILPDNKDGQERKVVERFVAHLRHQGRHFDPERLPEDDNDFLLKSTDEEISVLLEMVELVGRDYLVEASDEYLNNPNPRFQNWVYIAKNEIYGIDENAKTNSIKKKIEHKIKKHYPKPLDKEFWLLIWTVQSDHSFEWWEGGAKQLSTSVLTAREFLTTHGPGPFDQIWVYYPELNPCRIWPVEHS